MLMTFTALSIFFQLLASVLALRLIRVTKRTAAWVFLATGLSLMTVRRIESLFGYLTTGVVRPGDLTFEIVGFVLSVFMFAGVYYIRPVFSEIMRTRDELRTSNERLSLLSNEQRILLEHTRDFIYRHDTKGIITYVSPAVEKITGYTQAEWRDHYSKHYTENEVNRNGIEQTNAMLRTGQEGPAYRVEVNHVNGGTVWLEVNKQPYFEKGSVAGFIGVARDITKRVTMEEERENLIAELQDALANLRTLKGLLPICASCKKIRDDQGYWQQIESYITERSEAEFSHCLCPDCARKLYPEQMKRLK